jgi:hypothetical protein
MSIKKVPVRLISAVSGDSAPVAETPSTSAQTVEAAGISQISMKDLERLKARSRELMGLIIAAQHRS